VRNLDYRDDFTLWEANLRTRPEDAKAYAQLADACEVEGRFDEAIALYRRAIAEAWGGYLPVAEARLAVLALWKGDVDDVRQLLQGRAGSLDADYCLALDDYRRGRLVEAAERFADLHKAYPRLSPLVFALAVVRQDQGDAAAGRELVARGLEIFPDYASYVHQKALSRLDNPFFATPLGRAEALFLARQAMLASGGTDPEILATLARAEAGRK
jgi:tetratricopeptide (TPR) repeat protein